MQIQSQRTTDAHWHRAEGYIIYACVLLAARYDARIKRRVRKRWRQFGSE